MDLGLDGKVALVAGGSSGMGLAIAAELAREGARVAIGARGADQLKLAAASLEGIAPGRISASAVDLTDSAATRQWVDRVAGEFGGLHIVLVNGGSPPVGGPTSFALADYQAAVDAVLLPAVGLALAAVPHLRSAGWGRLLFVASETAVLPIAPLTLSGMARTAVVRFAQGLAADLGPAGITVNVIAPGTVRTPPVERAAVRLATLSPGQAPGQPPGQDEIEKQVVAIGGHSAIGRIGRPEEIAAVAAFLASERASFVTGTVHLVDGGASVTGGRLPHLVDASPDIFT